MQKILSLFVLLFFVACGGGGIEGYVGESISITAENPEEGKDVDYNWTLANQPDGSLMNSTDLFSSDDGQKMSFIPDYPGDYSIGVSVSQYGDEIATQVFSFSILDPNEDEEESEINKNLEDQSNEEWLNEDLDEETVEDDDTEEFEDEELEDEEIDDNEIDDDENNVGENDDVSDDSAPTELVKKAALTPVVKSASIAAKTDRYTIQITSKRFLKDAQQFSQNMISKGYDAYIQKAAFDGNEDWYRVRVGSYDTYNSAKLAADVLSIEIGMATWVDFVRKVQ
ncbi:SPOR domain-containing protein [Candidatus Marinimicrobia bacterium]|nr:SPOR domain-containing protein [Candidatus Neomarinimicrobiota bacterium]